jgi:predicted aldo/keto reductase-like oxidoreductase
MGSSDGFYELELAMSRITRRGFLSATAALTASVATGRHSGWSFAAETATTAAEPIRIKTGVDLMTLGASGIKTSVLGMGTGTRGGREQRELGPDRFTRLVHEAYDLGLRYIDTADNYKMHDYVRRALKEVPRHELFIQTKTPAKEASKARADIDRYRKEMGIEQLDSVLMHCMRRKGWVEDMRPVRDVLLDAKRKGQVRAVGVSCHGMDPLVDSVDCDDLDIHLVRINPTGIAAKMDGAPTQVAEQIKRMHAKGRQIIGMKIYGEGAFQSRQQRLDSLKYVLSLGCLSAFTIGFKDVQQIQETLELIQDAST